MRTYLCGKQVELPHSFTDCLSSATSIDQMSQLELQQAALEGLALPHDLAVQAAPFYQPGFSKPQVDRTRDGLRNR